MNRSRPQEARPASPLQSVDRGLPHDHTLPYGSCLTIYAQGRQGGAGVTVPNMITILRLLLVPAVVYWLLTGEWQRAFAGFVIAGISDGVDGFIARRFNQRSKLGGYLDPMADKLLLVSVFVVLGFMGKLPLWLVIAAVSRDALIVCAVLLSTVMANPVEMKPLMVSKANTAAQILLAAVVLAELAFAADFGPLRPVLIILSGLLTMASAGAYLVAWSRHMSRYGEGGPHAGQ